MNKTTNAVIISRWTDNLAYPISVETPAEASILDILTVIYSATNADDRPFGRQVCSTSIGDLIVVDATFWLVDRVGFKKLAPHQAITWQKIDARDAHDGWDWCVKHNVITAAGEIARK